MVRFSSKGGSLVKNGILGARPRPGRAGPLGRPARAAAAEKAKAPAAEAPAAGGVLLPPPAPEPAAAPAPAQAPDPHEDQRFLAEVVYKVGGWLEDYAAYRTMDLLSFQERTGVRGPLLEIGVFKGRYLTILFRSALRTGDRLTALDTFQYSAMQEAKDSVAPVGDPALVNWMQANSTAFTAADLLACVEGRPRFISVDGSHALRDVHWDMTLCEQLLAFDGIISVDDFLNPVTLGVNEALHRFFAQPRNLEPFAYTHNKLFLCRPAQGDLYRRAMAESAAAATDPISVNFSERYADPVRRHHVEQQLWGSPVLIL
jgi:hypothetical protein